MFTCGCADQFPLSAAVVLYCYILISYDGGYYLSITKSLPPIIICTPADPALMKLF